MKYDTYEIKHVTSNHNGLKILVNTSKKKNTDKRFNRTFDLTLKLNDKKSILDFLEHFRITKYYLLYESDSFKKLMEVMLNVFYSADLLKKDKNGELVKECRHKGELVADPNVKLLGKGDELTFFLDTKKLANKKLKIVNKNDFKIIDICVKKKDGNSVLLNHPVCDIVKFPYFNEEMCSKWVSKKISINYEYKENKNSVDEANNKLIQAFASFVKGKEPVAIYNHDYKDNDNVYFKELDSCGYDYSIIKKYFWKNFLKENKEYSHVDVFKDSEGKKHKKIRLLRKYSKLQSTMETIDILVPLFSFLVSMAGEQSKKIDKIIEEKDSRIKELENRMDAMEEQMSK